MPHSEAITKALGTKEEKPDEEEQVQNDYQRASNANKLLELGQTALDLLSEQETSLLSQAGLLGRSLQEMGECSSRIS